MTAQATEPLTEPSSTAASCLGGVQPKATYAPATEQECAEIILEAQSAGYGVVPVGASTCMDMNLSPRGSAYAWLHTGRLGHDVQIAASDSLVTCSAAAPFATVQGLLRQANQRIAADPPYAAEATVGGVVAANAYGLLRCSSGPVGDLVVAMRMVTGAGEVIKAGARVVKNAAGYDLCRLVAGSRGALGVITEVTFRTNPVRQKTLEHAADVPDLTQGLSAAWALHEELPRLDYVAVLGGQDQPNSCTILYGASGSAQYLGSVEIQASAVLGRHGIMASASDPEAASAAEDARRCLHGCGMGSAIRLSVPRASGLAAATYVAARSERWVWLVPCGILAAGALSRSDTAASRLVEMCGLVLERSHQCVWLRKPLDPGLARRLPALSPSVRRLIQGLKSVFDPVGVLSPGLLDGAQ